MPSCPNCHANYEGQSLQFCLNCGARLVEQDDIPTEVRPSFTEAETVTQTTQGRLKVIKIGDLLVIECIHCTGSGICEHSTKKFYTTGYSVRNCSKCDSGTYVKDPADPPPPTCKVCDGKGYTVP